MVEVRFNSEWDGFDIANDRLEEEVGYFEEYLAITGNRNFRSMGSETALNIISGNYYDDELAEEVGNGYEYDVIEELNKIMGGDWQKDQLTGYSQGDWQDIYYDADVVNEKTIEYIDYLFMNKGTELQVYYDDEYQYSDYITKENWKLTKAIVSDWIGEDVDKLVEYENKTISVAGKEID